jgi:hypothetical protein
MTTIQREQIKAPQSEGKISLDDFLDRCERLAIERQEIISSGNGSHEAPTYCECRELISPSGTRWPCPPHHDCEYIRQRNELIPEAVRIANNHCSPIGKNCTAFRKICIAGQERIPWNLSKQSNPREPKSLHEMASQNEKSRKAKTRKETKL